MIDRPPVSGSGSVIEEYGSADPDPKEIFTGLKYWSFERFAVPAGHIPRPESTSSSREPHKTFFLCWSEASLSPGG